MRRRQRRAFGLLEVMLALMILSTALLGLSAAVNGAIDSAGDSINRRAAREQCRAKVEEILAGTIPPEGGGDIEDYPGFTWTSRTEELMLGTPEFQSEKVKVVIVEMEFPTINRGEGEEGATAGSAEAGRDKISLASVIPAEPAQ